MKIAILTFAKVMNRRAPNGSPAFVGQNGGRLIDQFWLWIGCSTAQRGPNPSVVGISGADYQEIWDFLGARKTLIALRSLLYSGFMPFAQIVYRKLENVSNNNQGNNS